MNTTNHIEPKTDHVGRVVCAICRRSELVTGEIIATFYGWHLDDDRATCPSCDEAKQHGGRQ